MAEYMGGTCCCTPRLEFVFDETVEGAAHLTRLIDQAVADDRAAAAAQESRTPGTGTSSEPATGPDTHDDTPGR